MTEQPTETVDTRDPETFDLDEWLAGGTAHRARVIVPIYRDANLLAEVQRIDAAMKRAEQMPADMESMGEPATTDLEQQKAELLDRIQAAKADVEVYALIDSELDQIKKALGGDKKPANYPWHTDSAFWHRVLEQAATIDGRRLTHQEWRALHNAIGMQFASIVSAYTEAGSPDVSPRFRR